MKEQQTQYTPQQSAQRKKFMQEFETTYADQSQIGMGNRDKEFMDQVKVDLNSVPSAPLGDPEHEYDGVRIAVKMEAKKKVFTYTGPPPSGPHSEAYRHFVATWDHVPDAIQYGGQADVPKDIDYDIHKVPELEKQVEEKKAALEEAGRRMTPEEYNYLKYKRDPRPEALPQTEEQKRKEMDFLRSFEGVEDTS